MTTIKKSISYQIILPKIIRIGAGVLNTLGSEVAKWKLKKVLIVTDPGVFQSGWIRSVKEQLVKASVEVDFIRGATRSKCGKSILAFRSTASRGKYSRIVPGLDPGAVITTSRCDVHYVVTEYGIAN